jgi:hypothetical protein
MNVVQPNPSEDEGMTSNPPYKFGDFMITAKSCEYYAKFEVDEIGGYEYEDATDDYTKPCNMERYLVCTIKWDSCSHFTFGDENGYLHICGVNAFVDHVVLVKHLYEKAFDLMGQQPSYRNEWPLTESEIAVMLSKYE